MVLGVDIGGSKLLAVAMNRDGCVTGRWRLRTGPSFSPERALDALDRILDSTGPVGAVGMGFPGLVRSGIGVARSSIMLEGWEEVPIREQVEHRFGLLCGVDNDVNNAARAERQVRKADGDGVEDFLFITVGTGVGGALVLAGELWTGGSGLAGEIGHVTTGRAVWCACGRMGCVGAVAGSRASVPGATRGRMQGAEHRNAWGLQKAARCLGSAVADAMNLLNLPLVVLGGGTALVGEPFRSAVDAGFRHGALREVADSCRIEFARTGYDAGALGSALLAMEAQGTVPLPTPAVGSPSLQEADEFRGAI